MESFCVTSDGYFSYICRGVILELYLQTHHWTQLIDSKDNSNHYLNLPACHVNKASE